MVEIYRGIMIIISGNLLRYGYKVFCLLQLGGETDANQELGEFSYQIKFLVTLQFFCSREHVYTIGKHRPSSYLDLEDKRIHQIPNNFLGFMLKSIRLNYGLQPTDKQCENAQYPTLYCLYSIHEHKSLTNTKYCFSSHEPWKKRGKMKKCVHKMQA